MSKVNQVKTNSGTYACSNMLNVKCHSDLYSATYVVIGFTVHESEGGHLCFASVMS